MPNPPVHTTSRPAAMAMTGGLILLTLLLAGLIPFGDFTVPGHPWKFTVIGLAAGLVYFFAVILFDRTISRSRSALLWFWGGAVVLRLVALAIPPGDDVWRYIWEGMIQWQGFNPYAYPPDAPELAHLREMLPQWDLINHPPWTTIYPPGAELIFAAISLASLHVLVYKVVFMLADLGVVYFIYLICRDNDQRPAGAAAWYAWNPLVIYSFTGGAHFDSLMLLPLVAAFYALEQSRRAPDRNACWSWALISAVLVGIAISIKVVPLLLLPIWALALRWRAVVLILAPAIPLLLSLRYGWPEVPVWDALRHFTQYALANDLFWWMLEETIWPPAEGQNLRYNVLLAITTIGLSLIFHNNWKRGMLWVLGVAVVITPVWHSWYSTWMLPLAALRRSYAWFVFSTTSFAYFLFWETTLGWQQWERVWWHKAAIILPPLLVGAVLAIWQWRRSGDEEAGPAWPDLDGRPRKPVVPRKMLRPRPQKEQA